MSWDADFDGRWWNYTHNTNKAVNTAASEALDPPPADTWWKVLDGMDGAEGAAFLAPIIKELEQHPDKYRPMDPPNGWGDYEGILRVLREMKSASDQVCCNVRKWQVSG